MFCKQTTLGRGYVKLNCPPNSRLDIQNVVFGVISNAFDSFDHCHQTDVNRVLKGNTGLANCTKYVKQDVLKQKLVKECSGKNNCSVSTKGIMDWAFDQSG